MKKIINNYYTKNKLRTILSEILEINENLLYGDYEDENLLGIKLHVQPRDLLYLFFEIERQFGIEIPAEDVINGKFNTFNNIVKIIDKQLKIEDKA